MTINELREKGYAFPQVETLENNISVFVLTPSGGDSFINPSRFTAPTWMEATHMAAQAATVHFVMNKLAKE